MAIYKNGKYLFNKDKEYIHYGSDHYDPSKMDIKKNDHYPPSKPKTGLWGSPVESDDWRYWCEGENWNLESLEKNFKFKLKEDARILYIDEIEQIIPYVDRDPYGWNVDIDDTICGIHYDILYKKYDGIEICHDKDYAEMHYGIFYSWDVDSICVWNRDAIIELSP